MRVAFGALATHKNFDVAGEAVEPGPEDSGYHMALLRAKIWFKQTGSQPSIRHNSFPDPDLPNTAW